MLELVSFNTLNFEFFQKFIIFIISLMILIKYGFEEKSTFSDSLFVYYMFGIGVFLVTYCMLNLEISLGFAFGLFAIFSMLRYRTEVLSFKEMTYLFLVIVLSLLSAVSPLSNIELIVVNAIILTSAFFIQSNSNNSILMEKIIKYENIENIKPENYANLIEDLKRRTGLKIKKVTISSIDFMQDSAMLKVFYL